jgi:hypothetical protein
MQREKKTPKSKVKVEGTNFGHHTSNRFRSVYYFQVYNWQIAYIYKILDIKFHEVYYRQHYLKFIKI